MGITIDLKDKNMVIFGGGKGLGREIAVTLAKAGANVFIGNRSEDDGNEAKEAIEDIGVKAGFHKVDIGEEENVKEFIKAAEEFYPEGIDILVQNAGIISTDDIFNIDESDALGLYKVNVLGTGFVLKYGLEHMMEREKGKIITVASIAGEDPLGMLEHYSATKAAVISLTKNMATIAAPYHINVNAISPGIIRTDMWEELLDSMEEDNDKSRDEIFDEKVKELIPFGVAQTEQDIANAALFLASDLAKEITGTVLSVDGGTSM